MSLLFQNFGGDEFNMAKMTITWSSIQEHIVLILAMLRQTLAC